VSIIPPPVREYPPRACRTYRVARDNVQFGNRKFEPTSAIVLADDRANLVDAGAVAVLEIENSDALAGVNDLVGVGRVGLAVQLEVGAFLPGFACWLTAEGAEPLALRCCFRCRFCCDIGSTCAVVVDGGMCGCFSFFCGDFCCCFTRVSAKEPSAPTGFGQYASLVRRDTGGKNQVGSRRECISKASYATRGFL